MNNNKQILIKLLNLIYPPKCGICGKLNNNFLCKKCYKILENESKFVIEKNSSTDNVYNRHFYMFKYEGMIRRIILKYKFQEKSYLYKSIVYFGKL